MLSLLNAMVVWLRPDEMTWIRFWKRRSCNSLPPRQLFVTDLHMELPSIHPTISTRMEFRVG